MCVEGRGGGVVHRYRYDVHQSISVHGYQVVYNLCEVTLGWCRDF